MKPCVTVGRNCQRPVELRGASTCRQFIHTSDDRAYSAHTGMVLMTVLWIVLVISFIAFTLAAAVRVEMLSAGNSFDSQRAIFMAKGAAETVLQKLTDANKFPPSPMREEAGMYIFDFDSGEVRIKEEFDNSRIDLNGADEKLLRSMFDSLGIDPSIRDGLVDSILDWRDLDDVPRPNGAEVDDYAGAFDPVKRLPFNGPFKNAQEVMLVKHMTPDIYFGRVSFDANSNQHHKILGLRDVATVGSGGHSVDVNTAAVEVFMALPGIKEDMAAKILAAREQKPFVDQPDLIGRIPELKESAGYEYLTTVKGVPNVLIATATVRPSGTSKTVRLLLRPEREKKIITYDPLIYIDTPVVKFGSWEY